ncbi:unnamed protein product [Cuscuta epithymum]|uniref:Uncharacterized protein n=1 Tax=Cuscuta epithymum TaxID=186058 RepID=A0AAV0G8J4_9ASTE|nr:unnamed protein product [Cuscuta epithymum]
MNNEKLLKKRKANKDAAKAALAKAKAAQASEANSSASQPDRCTAEAEQELIANVMGQGSEALNIDTVAALNATPLNAVPRRDGEKAKEKRMKRPWGDASASGAEDVMAPSLSRPAADLWREFALRSELSSPSGSSSEAVNAILTDALSALRLKAVVDDALKAKGTADAALKKVQEGALLQAAAAADKEKQLQAALDVSLNKVAVFKKHDFKLVHVPPTFEDGSAVDAAPSSQQEASASQSRVDMTGYKASDDFMIAAQRYCRRAFCDVFGTELVAQEPKDCLNFGIHLLERNPLDNQFLLDVADDSFDKGYVEGVKAMLPAFAKLGVPASKLVDYMDDEDLKKIVGKIARDQRRAEAVARGEVSELPTPKPEPNEEEAGQGDARPKSPNFC